VSTVIGLFPCNQEVSYQLEQLEGAGFTKDNIQVLTNARTVLKLLGCEPNCVVARCAGWGALFGIALYGVFALVASWCDCFLFQFSHPIAFEIILVGTIFGALIGGFMGGITGMAEYEKDTHLYTQGVRMGNSVLVLQTELGDVERAKSTLRQMGCIGVSIIPEQEGHVLRNK
jgi:hypothetical protein